MTNKEKAQQLLATVRASKALGHGSCSSVDECDTDEALLEQYTESFENGESAEQIIKFTLNVEQCFWERNGLYHWKDEHKAEIAELLAEIK